MVHNRIFVIVAALSLGSASAVAQQGEAIHAGKHGVQHQQVVDIAAGVVQAGDAVITHVGGIALAAQQVLFVSNIDKKIRIVRVEIVHGDVRQL